MYNLSYVFCICQKMELKIDSIDVYLYFLSFYGRE